MNTKRIVITGGPGSGKTSLIKFLEKIGYQVMQEISRELTLQAKKKGIDQLFIENPIMFSEQLLEGRLKQFQEGENFNTPILFYDRGLPDVTAYMDFAKNNYPENFSETCLKYKYDAIFILPPWEEIYEQDEVRYESFAQAQEIFNFLQKGYVNYGYKIHQVPVGTLSLRTNFILNSLKQMGYENNC